MAWDYPSHHALLLKEGVRPFNTATPAAFSASRKPLRDILPSCSATFLQLTSHPSGDHHLIVQEAKEERPSFKEEEGGGGRDVDPIGLKLGKRTYFEDSSSFATSHSNSNGTTNTNNKTGGRASKPSARCQVEGCKADLSTAKDYHRRHKVCDLHSKSASAVVSGIEQRFCQQCSRFHVVSEFDEGKRSCRRRLASHNERRRKPKMDPLTMRLPALQNDACFSQFFLPRNSLPYPSYPKTSSSPPFWEVSEQSKGYWPNSWNTGNDTLLATTEMGRQLFQQGNNMLFFSSPNVISTQRGFQALESSSSDLIGEGLSLCSTSGSIAFSPLETTTTGTTKTTTSSTSSIPARHSNSGCALSLLSLLQPATSLDLCMHSDMSAYQSLQVSEPSASSQVFIGGHHFGLDFDRMQKIGFDSDSDQMWKIGFDSDRMQQVGFDSDRMWQIGLEESDRMRQIGLDSNRMRQIGLDPNDGMRQMGLDSNDGMRQMGLDPNDGMRGLDPDDGMRQIGSDSDANRMRQIGLDSDDQMQQIGLDSDDQMRQIGFDSDSIRQIGLDSDFDRMRQIGLDSDWMRQIASDSNRMRQIKHGRDENRTIDLMHVAPFSSRSSYDQSYFHTPLQGGRSQLGPNQYSDVHGLRSYGTFSI